MNSIVTDDEYPGRLVYPGGLPGTEFLRKQLQALILRDQAFESIELTGRGPVVKWKK